MSRVIFYWSIFPQQSGISTDRREHSHHNHKVREKQYTCDLERSIFDEDHQESKEKRSASGEDTIQRSEIPGLKLTQGALPSRATRILSRSFHFFSSSSPFLNKIPPHLNAFLPLALRLRFPRYSNGPQSHPRHNGSHRRPGGARGVRRVPRQGR